MSYPLRLDAAAILALVATLALAGCGRRGPLELPPGAPGAPANAATAEQQTRVLNDQDTPGLIQDPNTVYEQSAAAKQQIFKEQPAPRPINAPPAAKTGSGFVLDPLL